MPTPRPTSPCSPENLSTLGRIDPRAAGRYLFWWSVVLTGVLFAALVVIYIGLAALGVLHPVSKVLALLEGHSSPGPGLVPILQPLHMLPLLLRLSMVTALLSALAGLGIVYVHNATTVLTGGIVVHLERHSAGSLTPPTTSTAIPRRSSAPVSSPAWDSDLTPRAHERTYSEAGAREGH